MLKTSSAMRQGLKDACSLQLSSASPLTGYRSICHQAMVLPSACTISDLVYAHDTTIFFPPDGQAA